MNTEALRPSSQREPYLRPRDAMLAQSYTPNTNASVCGNCRYRVIGTDQRGRAVRNCSLGGFGVVVLGTCELHEFPAVEAPVQGPSQEVPA